MSETDSVTENAQVFTGGELEGEMFTARVVSVTSPIDFCVMDEEDMKYSQSISDKIEGFLNDNWSGRLEVSHLLDDAPFVAVQAYQGKWSRGKVVAGSNHFWDHQDETGDNQLHNFKRQITFLKVHLIDYNIVERMRLTEIKFGPPEVFDFEKWPIRYLRCSLTDVMPYPDEDLWSDDCLNTMKGLILDKDVHITVSEALEDGTLVVHVYYPIQDPDQKDRRMDLLFSLAIAKKVRIDYREPNRSPSSKILAITQWKEASVPAPAVSNSIVSVDSNQDLREFDDSGEEDSEDDSNDSGILSS